LKSSISLGASADKNSGPLKYVKGAEVETVKFVSLATDAHGPFVRATRPNKKCRRFAIKTIGLKDRRSGLWVTD